MGRPKQLLPVGEIPLVERSARVLLAAGQTRATGLGEFVREEPRLPAAARKLYCARLAELVVVLGHKAPDVAGALSTVDDPRLRLIVNDRYEEGMGSSIRAGVSCICSEACAVLIALCDNPCLDVNTVETLLAAQSTSEKGIFVPVFRARRGHPVIFSARYIAELLGLEGDEGGRGILRRHPDDVEEVPVSSGNCLVNINTPEEWKEIQISPGKCLVDTEIQRARIEKDHDTAKGA
jgi:molybdenum cofactor cytidylyltransferase